MATINLWHWLMDFFGINNTYDSFSTHMYNFWSGFGGNVSILALAGLLLGLYRHYHKYLRSIHPVNFAKKPLEIIHKKENSEQ